MSGREAKATISNLLRMPRHHQKEIISEKWLKDLLLRAKRVGQFTCGTEKHRYLFFFLDIWVQQAETKGHFIQGSKSWSQTQNLRQQLHQELDSPCAVGLMVLITLCPRSGGPNSPKIKRKFIFTTWL